MTRESLIEVPRWVTAFNFPIIGGSDSPPDYHCPPSFVLFVYFPSHPFSQSLRLLSFFLSLLALVWSLPLPPVSFLSHWYSPTLRLFSNCHLYFLIFQFPVFLKSFLLIYLIAYYLLLHLPRFLYASFLIFLVFFTFVLLSISSPSIFFCFLHFLFSLPFSFFYLTFHSISSHFLLFFFLLDCFISFLLLSFSAFSFFLLLSSFPLMRTSFSAVAKQPSS